MKRNILLALVAAFTISLIATGPAFAQGGGPSGNAAATETNINMSVTLSDYMPQAMADMLGLTVDEVNVRLAAGGTFYSIALSQGYTADQLSVLMTDVRNEAIALATANGVITAEQSSYMLNSQYGGNARGMGAGTANMYSTGDGTVTDICDGTCIPQSANTQAAGSMQRRGGRR